MQVNNSTLANAVQMHSAMPAVKWFEPLADGSMTPQQWFGWLMEANAMRKDGTTYPAVYAVNGAAPFAASQVTKSLWAAQQMGFVGYAHAVHQAKCFQALAESVTHSLAGQLRQSVPEVPAASVLIRTAQDGGNEATPSVKEQVREALEEAQKRFDAGQLTRSEFTQVAQALKEQWEDHKAREAMSDGENDHQGASDDSVAEDEGALQVALHMPQELWRYEPNEILGSEALMVSAAKQFGKIDLPVDHPDWSTFVERVAEALAVSVDYASNDEAKKAEKEKAETRLLVAQQGIAAAPKKARWAVNHLARRIWRDMQVLSRKIDAWELRKERISEQIMREERFNLPATMSRIMSERPTDTGDEPRRFFLIWEVVDEAAMQPIDFNGLSQGRFEIETLGNAQSHAASIISRMDELYKLVRQVDEALSPIWAAHASPGMPEQPPVYWNHRGFYLTEDEAREAMEAEDEEHRAAQKAATIHGAASHLQQMLAAQGLA